MLCVNVSSDQIHDVTVDSRGRLTPGAEYSHEHVVVGIVNEKSEQPDGGFEVGVDAESVKSPRTVDGGGRVSIGSEDAGEKVVVAVLERGE